MRQAEIVEPVSRPAQALETAPAGRGHRADAGGGAGLAGTALHGGCRPVPTLHATDAPGPLTPAFAFQAATLQRLLQPSARTSALRSPCFRHLKRCWRGVDPQQSAAERVTPSNGLLLARIAAEPLARRSTADVVAGLGAEFVWSRSGAGCAATSAVSACMHLAAPAGLQLRIRRRRWLREGKPILDQRGRAQPHPRARSP